MKIPENPLNHFHPPSDRQDERPLFIQDQTLLPSSMALVKMMIVW